MRSAKAVLVAHWFGDILFCNCSVYFLARFSQIFSILSYLFDNCKQRQPSKIFRWKACGYWHKHTTKNRHIPDKQQTQAGEQHTADKSSRASVWMRACNKGLMWSMWTKRTLNAHTVKTTQSCEVSSHMGWGKQECEIPPKHSFCRLVFSVICWVVWLLLKKKTDFLKLLSYTNLKQYCQTSPLTMNAIAQTMAIIFF